MKQSAATATVAKMAERFLTGHVKIQIEASTAATVHVRSNRATGRQTRSRG
ncbi:MAG: hypothetical protein OXQ29_13780 [Rhodospirillaceae bacterium]|nr:hypothetical protein [Rhodospirillaceae bacterium]